MELGGSKEQMMMMEDLMHFADMYLVRMINHKE